MPRRSILGAAKDTNKPSAEASDSLVMPRRSILGAAKDANKPRAKASDSLVMPGRSILGAAKDTNKPRAEASSLAVYRYAPPLLPDAGSRFRRIGSVGAEADGGSCAGGRFAAELGCGRRRRVGGRGRSRVRCIIFGARVDRRPGAERTAKELSPAVETSLRERRFRRCENRRRIRCGAPCRGGRRFVGGSLPSRVPEKTENPRKPNFRGFLEKAGNPIVVTPHFKLDSVTMKSLG